MDSAGTLTAKGTKRILVVDDELSVREILAEGLEEFGFETDMAANADEAMAMLEKEQFHLLLTDIDMPGRSGIALMNDAKASFPDLDVVMVTGVVDANLDPSDPETLIVATYERERDGFDTNSPAKKWGPGSGIWKSTDGGATFRRLTDGLPTADLGRVDIEYHRSDPSVVYALVE